MMREVQKEFSSNAQCMAKEYTNRVRKEMMFDNKYEPLEKRHGVYQSSKEGDDV